MGYKPNFISQLNIKTITKNNDNNDDDNNSQRKIFNNIQLNAKNN